MAKGKEPNIVKMFQAPLFKEVEIDLSRANQVLPVTQSWMEATVTTLSMFFFFSILFLLPNFTFYSIYLILRYGLAANTNAILFLAAELASVFTPPTLHAWPAYIRSQLWVWWASYFSFSVIFLDHAPFKKGPVTLTSFPSFPALPSSPTSSGVSLSTFPDMSSTSSPGHPPRFIFSESPHGIFPMGQWLSQAMYNRVLPRAVPIKGLGATSIFYMPLLRNLYGCMGVVPATRSYFFQTLLNYNVAIIPGGIAELFLAKPNHPYDELFIKSRKGFIKLALQSGSSLVPVYIFGNTGIFHRLSSGLGLFTSFARRTGISCFIFWGRFYLPIPYRCRISMVIGSPIPVARVEHPTQEQIDELHARFVKAVEHVFETSKAAVGEGHLSLRLI